MFRHKILIVDDELEVCILINNFLKTKNQYPSYATTLKEGLEKFKTIQPDILLLDHNMPDGFGIDLIQKFKQINNSTRIVIMSAMSNLKVRALEDGADLFLEKPISFTMLKTLID